MNKKPTTNVALVGQHHGKIDIERVAIKLSTCISRIFTDKVFLGFFTDPPPGPFDVYQKPIQFRDVAKGRQILSGPRIQLFTKAHERIFEGEAYTELWRNEARKRIEDEKRKIGGHMKPTSPSKKHSSPGDWYGCFAKSSYFSPMWKEKEKKKTPLPNMKIKPNPLGGPGYTNICLNPYPSYSHEPYDRTRAVGEKVVSEGRFLRTSAPLDYFPPNPYKDEEPGPTYIPPIKIARKTLARFYVPFPKKPGGSHDGCFSKFPEYTGDPYVKAKDKAAVPERKFISGGPFLRSKYTNSIIEQITKISCNARNYSEYRERVYPMY
ncbi:CD047 protein, partial [Acromyrmex charruanus]